MKSSLLFVYLKAFFLLPKIMQISHYCVAETQHLATTLGSTEPVPACQSSSNDTLVIDFFDVQGRS